MKKIIFILPIICMFMACKKQNIETPGLAASGARSVSVFINFKNTTGQDLLNPATPNAIDIRDLKVYALKSNGQKEIYFKGNLDMPQGIKISQEADLSYSMTFYFQSEQDDLIGNTITRFIKFKDGSEVKLKSEFNNTKMYINSSFMIQKLWIDDNLVANNRNEIFSLQPTIVR